MGWTHKKCFEKNGLDGLTVIYDFQDEGVDKMIYGLKFGLNKRLAKRVLDSCSLELGMNFEVVIPVPLYIFKKNWRGFNQAEVIGVEVAKNLNIDLVDALWRIRNTGQMSLGMNKKERIENMTEAFSLKKYYKERLKGRAVLLVDDVFTSGSTMKECAKVLKQAGVSFVWGFALAH